DRRAWPVQRVRGEGRADDLERVLRVDGDVGLAVLLRLAAQALRDHVHDRHGHYLSPMPASRSASSCVLGCRSSWWISWNGASCIRSSSLLWSSHSPPCPAFGLIHWRHWKSMLLAYRAATVPPPSPRPGAPPLATRSASRAAIHQAGAC